MNSIMTSAEIENVLQSQSICRLACNDKKFPHLIPISYFYDGKYIYCQSQHGKKIELMQKDPNVTILVDIIGSMNNYKSVIVNGEYQELKGHEADDARKLLFEQIFSLMTTTRIHFFQHEEAGKIDDSERIKIIMFRIKILNTSGRKEE
ncbi:MAG: pyridoxamine 5'-phosphate oxidase family protein [Sphingobacteriales bacterium]|nr:pyridoxamine 5'-phosphate oxidase family protein [Sphingobacteriales bacterium]